MIMSGHFFEVTAFHSRLLRAARVLASVWMGSRNRWQETKLARRLLLDPFAGPGL